MAEPARVIDPGTIALVERCAANAWPATTARLAGGWLLRSTPGVRRSRSNSALPLAPGGGRTLLAGIDRAERFYAGRSQPCVVSVSPVQLRGRLDAELAARGYEREQDVHVLAAPVELVLASTAPAGGARVTVADRVTAPWVAAQAVAEPRGDQLATVDKVLARIEPATGFALATDAAGTGLGVVFGVAERGWAGIFCMATRPDARRRGVATGLLHALARWAAGQGAGRLYLQTYASNGPALALYAGAGFEQAYGYHYRRARLAVDSPAARAER